VTDSAASSGVATVDRPGQVATARHDTARGDTAPGDPAREDAALASAAEDTAHRFIVVANRLPVDQVTHPDGSLGWRRSPGGLVSALEPVMRRLDGAWVGWIGVPTAEADSGPDGEPVAPAAFSDGGFDLVPVALTAREVAAYYEGFSNGTLWPLYHDVIAVPQYHRTWWDSYVRVNRRFAEQVARIAAPDAVVWVQDYQLQLVPAMLRALRPDLRIGFFLHIPFPPVELFAQLPWRRQVLEGLLGADLVGFQVPGAAANFLRLAERFTDFQVRDDHVEVGEGRRCRAAAFPISIDTAEMGDRARHPAVQARTRQLREDLGNPRTILLGVDRLDYTKGIVHRLKAYGELLADGVLEAGSVTFVQVATPSRERVEEYRVLRDEIELLVGRLNGDHGRIGSPVVHYMHSSYDRDEMAALFGMSDVMVVTPLRDGMNLVAKEYVATRVDLGGALVLSEFTGAALELPQAFLVNPHDIDGLKAVLVKAIDADPAELVERMRAMRHVVEVHDVDAWADGFLAALDDPEPSALDRVQAIPASIADLLRRWRESRPVAEAAEDARD